MNPWPTPIVLPAPTATFADISAPWILFLAGGGVGIAATCIVYAALNGPRHRTIATLGRARRLQNRVLLPLACLACAALVTGASGSNGDMARTWNDQVEATEAELEPAPAGHTWRCEDRPALAPLPAVYDRTLQCELSRE